ncbi:hypothetical protein MMAG44476_28499 [Mycolicibacterium mageritense DSM 44476 = CIP 104973]|uniref:Mammalian cell entry protein n=1 Tax=Mycolicibacterium mageritense TaxID=53462 RepID=A0AAI8TW40_MYCME|nr:hypothetical protein [Mycolicibacterium mageritense]MBN3457073.1 hypothetical protein [Mycobacterium sp. DSM 3803]MCC9180720.1 hypothetical protein [Mycolicibacterium mageritense]TXI52206.1 MAG: hypothetical protein E6Q55_37335 [Mycolicibacterium mageritense]CDO20990.1 mce associated membrane protein [Mycolicibacterium mageritense DSM 44476 = CIP 104973]BBX34491.1 hypothetical protein MMAGJ_37730 [Mycolicibacterium mageritense]
MSKSTRSTSWKALVGVLCAGIIALTALGTWQMVEKNRPAPVPISDQADARRAVLDVAKDSVQEVLGYYPELDDQTIAKTGTLLTGEAADQYPNWIKAKLAAAKTDGSSQGVTVNHAGIENIAADKATAIVFVEAKVTKLLTAPTRTRFGIRVGLTKVDGKWLINSLPVLKQP